MPKDRDPFLWRLSDHADQNGDVDLISEPVRRGEVWVAEEISYWCETANQATVHVGLTDGNTVAWLWSSTPGNDEFWYNAPLTLTGLSDYQVVVRFDGVGASSRCNANVNGYVIAPFTSP